MKKKQKKKLKYDIDEKEEKSTEDKVDRIFEIKQLDESNPLERAIEYDYVKRNLPKPDYMKVAMKEVENNEEDKFVVTTSKDEEGKPKILIHEPFRVVDLLTSVEADIGRCPSHIGPMLIDEYVKINVEEKDEFKPEIRKEPFRWWWIVVPLMMLPGIILVILMFL